MSSESDASSHGTPGESRADGSDRPLSLDQFQGAVLGLAVGDAVAAPWEGVGADLIFINGPADKIVAHVDGGTIYYTDDTQMTIGVVQTLLACGTMEKEPLARRFAENYHPDRGYGQGARRIINAVGAGEDWETLAATLFGGEGSLGNGAAMRAAPIGLFFSTRLEVVREAERAAAPTHRHELGVDGARLMAAAAYLAARSAGAPFDRRRFFRRLHTVARTEEFRWQLRQAGRLAPSASPAGFGNSLEAHRSVVTALFCFAASPDSYADTVARALGQGNDVDTLAAMAGALSGARLGLSAIPPRLLDCLENGPQGRSFLLDLSTDLYAASLRRRTRKYLFS